MKDDTSTPTTDGLSPNEFEKDKPGTNARTQAEAAIEELRKRGGLFVEAVRATRMPMALTDPNLPGNPIVFANGAFLKLAGYRMEDVLGEQPYFMNGPGTDPRDAARFAEAIRGDQDDVIETVQYRKDGSRFVATVLISAFKDEEGRVLNHFMSWLDVTRRVEAEEEITALKITQSRLRESEALLAQDLAHSRALQAAGQAMIDIPHEDQAEAAILAAARSIMDADAASLQQLDPHSGELVLLAHTGLHPDSAAFWARVTRENGMICGQALNGRTRTIVEDVAADAVLSQSDDLPWYQLSGIVAVQTTPLITRSGQIVGMISTHWRHRHRPDERELTHFDVLARQAADLIERRAAEAALRESEARLAAAFESVPAGIAVLDLNGQAIIANAEFRRFLPTGVVPSRDPDYLHQWKAWDDDGQPLDPQDWPGARALRGESVVPGQEMLYTDEDGREIWTNVATAPTFDESGNVTGVVSVISDIDERKRAEESLKGSERHTKLLLAELQHRVRNTLAVVRSMARRTASNTESADDMLAHFQGRLDAFSRVQAALTRNADARIDLASLIDDELVAHATRDGEQVHTEGPPIALEARAAERLSLAVHELTTNAVKHGALRNEHGRIEIAWEKRETVAGEQLLFTWVESGVSLEGLAPNRDGFGMELLRGSLAYDVGGEARVELRPTGLHFELRMPLNGNAQAAISA